MHLTVYSYEWKKNPKQCKKTQTKTQQDHKLVICLRTRSVCTSGMVIPVRCFQWSFRDDLLDLPLFGLFIRNWVEETKQLLITLAGDSKIGDANDVWADVSWWDGLSWAWMESPRGRTRWWAGRQNLWRGNNKDSQCDVTARREDPWVHQQGAGMEERRWFLCIGHFQDLYWISAPGSDVHTLWRVLEDDKGKEKSKNDAKICLTGRRLRSIF